MRTLAREYSIIAAFCRTPAATVTLVRRVPNICAKKSWVRGRVVLPIRSWLMSSHLASRATTSCRRLQAVAGGELRGLHGEHHGKTLQLLFQFPALGEDAEQEVGFHAVGGGIALGNDPQSAGLEAEDDGQADKTFSSNQADFHRLAVGLSGEDGTQAVVEEIHRLDGFSGLMEHLMKSETHKFRGRKNGSAFLAWNGAQDEVANFSAITVTAGRWAKGLERTSRRWFGH